MKNKYIGGSFTDFLEEEGIKEEVYNEAIKQVIAYQMQEIIEQKKITKVSLARQLETSRTAVDNLLDPTNDSVTLATLKKAATVLGKKLKLELV